ncbi:hypothetical protein BJ508DRAFT_310697 [Ascobolus immersus RN42]|uniref:Uncharacterized protein n=1 Tax=Ascobolus immersus RN42 TaxID=1160509 RepID=A0A3N4HWF2_ASCIM|nr:hypothetical protein BJ508DRAFT_310697 [Ascobolus immersus RN42]
MGNKQSKTVTETLTETLIRSYTRTTTFSTTLSTYTRVLLYTTTVPVTQTSVQTTTLIQPTTIHATETIIKTTHSPYPEWYDNTVLSLWLLGYVVILFLVGVSGLALVARFADGSKRDERKPLLGTANPPSYSTTARREQTPSSNRRPRSPYPRRSPSSNGRQSPILPQYTP